MEAPAAAKVAPPDFGSMRLKDYHRVVRANYVAVESPRLGLRPAPAFRLQTYLPFVLLLIGLAVGAALVFGRI